MGSILTTAAGLVNVTQFRSLTIPKLDQVVGVDFSGAAVSGQTAWLAEFEVRPSGRQFFPSNRSSVDRWPSGRQLPMLGDPPDALKVTLAMPELPEVETMRRGLLPILGSRIVSVDRPPCSRRPISFQPRIDAFDRRVRGKRIDHVDRRGKRVMIRLDDGQTIVIEPRMTGLVLLSDPPSVEHLRLRLRLRGRRVPQLLFWDRRGLGTVRLLHDRQVKTLIDQRLGVDALEVTDESLRQQLGRSRRVVKVALLDQHCVAGIGNLYASEILFVAGVDPRTRCDRISRPQWSRIAQAAVDVLTEAIRHEGSTLSDGTYRNALNDPGGYQNYHRVYDRAGSTCQRCTSGQIRRIVQAGRSTFFCPLCQRKSGIHSSVAIELKFAAAVTAARMERSEGL